MGIPDVENEDRPQRVASIPGFMFNSVVEDEGFSFYPFACFAPDAETAIRRHNQRQMHDAPNIGDAGMRRDMRSGA